MWSKQLCLTKENFGQANKYMKRIIRDSFISILYCFRFHSFQVEEKQVSVKLYLLYGIRTPGTESREVNRLQNQGRGPRL